MKTILTLVLIAVITMGAVGAAFYFLYLREEQETQQGGGQVTTPSEETDPERSTSSDSGTVVDCPTGYLCLGGSQIPTVPTITLGITETLAQEEVEEEAEEEETEEEPPPAESIEEEEEEEVEMAANTPQNVLITNKDFRIWSIAWVTETAQTGYIKYGTSALYLDSEENDDRDLDVNNLEELFTHHVTITNPEEDLDDDNLTYYFKIVSGGEEFDDVLSAYEYVNAPLTSSPSSPNSISVTANPVSGYPANDYIVIARQVDLGGEVSTPVSEIFTSSGGAELAIGIARIESLTSYFPYSSSNTLDVKLYGPAGHTGFVDSVRLSFLEGEVLNINTVRSGYAGAIFTSSYGSSYSLGEEEFPSTDLPQTGLKNSWSFFTVWGFVIFLLGVCSAVVFIPWNYQRLWERKVVTSLEEVEE